MTGYPPKHPSNGHKHVKCDTILDVYNADLWPGDIVEYQGHSFMVDEDGLVKALPNTEEQKAS